MASAAAVGVDLVRPDNSDNNLGQDYGGAGEITSAILPSDQPLPDLNGDDDDEDDDIQKTARRRGRIETANGDLDEEEANGVDDLFGDDDEEIPKRQIDDEELDSGDDEGRDDRLAEEAQAEEFQEGEAAELTIQELELPRQAGPEPSDGEMYLMKVPRFLSVEPKAWSHLDFQPPITDHHSKGQASATFSAYNTALSTLRWRRSPSNPSNLQSNARILRWSDGSLTLQLASDPKVQYEIDGNPLVAPQRNPVKPTPTSIKAGQKGITARGEKYNSSQDSFTYLVAPAEAAEVLRVSHKITAGLKVLSSAEKTDDALERLQLSLAAAANATKTSGGTIDLMTVEEDPELQRKKAEVAEREKMRARKRREAQEERERDRSNRTLGRHGLSSSRYGGGGLTAGLLEDDEIGGSGGGRARGAAKPRKRTQRRNSEYSEDEDFGRRGFASKADEYDREDDFLAASDEDEEGGEEEDDDEDIDDGIVEEPRERTPKRDRPRPEPVSNAVEDDGEEGAVRTKRRRIVDDDDEDE